MAASEAYSLSVPIEDVFERWHAREEGYTRATMDRAQYHRMMARLNIAGKRRSNYQVTVKRGKAAYKAQKSAYMKAYRRRIFADEEEKKDFAFESGGAG
jgi:hypothetical protein